MSIQGDCVKEYLSKWPDAPALTLAKMIYKDNPSLFSSVESTRNSIRYYIGQNGDYHRNHITDKQFYREAGNKSPFENLPDGMRYIEDFSPVRIKEKKTLVVADIHAPYHDKDALLIALEYGYKADCDGVLILGDMHDFFSVSFWEKDPRKRDFQYELEITRVIYETISGGFPDAKLRIKIGNHEERYDRYLGVKAPELLGVDAFEFAAITHCDRHGFEVIGDRKILKIGTLNLVHGHEFGRSITAPVNPARGLFLRAKTHCLCAHHHQPSYHPEPDMNGKVIGCWSIGCLCDLHPQYLPINKWQHGFSIVERLGNEEFLVQNKVIIKGKVY